MHPDEAQWNSGIQDVCASQQAESEIFAALSEATVNPEYRRIIDGFRLHVVGLDSSANRKKTLLHQHTHTDTRIDTQKHTMQPPFHSTATSNFTLSLSGI